MGLEGIEEYYLIQKVRRRAVLGSPHPSCQPFEPLRKMCETNDRYGTTEKVIFKQFVDLN